MALKITDEQNYQDIADAIRGKLGSSDTFLPSEMADAIESIPTGPAPVEYKTMFIDYDGTVLYEYSQEEVDALTELPPLPSHVGLTCQGWNWTLSEIKSLGRQAIVGAYYITDNGRTRVYLSIPEKEKTVYCKFKESESYGVRIHWGDGTTAEPKSGLTISESHTYESAGDYVIEFEVVKGSIIVYGEMSPGSYLVYSNLKYTDAPRGVIRYISKIELGNNVKLNSYALAFTYAQTITIPASLESYGSGSEGWFMGSNYLKAVIFPRGLTAIAPYVCQNNVSLIYASFPGNAQTLGYTGFEGCVSMKCLSLPDSITDIPMRVFNSCSSIEKILLPSNVTSIGDQAFNKATGLKGCFNVPQSLTDIGSNAFAYTDIDALVIDNDELSIGSNAFAYCNNLSSIVINKPFEMTGDHVFYENPKLQSVELSEDVSEIPAGLFAGAILITEVTLPDTITEIGESAFKNCANIIKLVLPEGLTFIDEDAFYSCSKLRELIIPPGVDTLSDGMCYTCTKLTSVVCMGNIVSIENNCFASCVEIKEYDFSHCTAVPTVTGTRAIYTSSSPTIKIPAALYDAFVADSFWSAYKNYFVAV